MGAHSVPRGEYSTYGHPNGAPRRDPKHEGQHRKGTATGSSGQNQTTPSVPRKNR
jgi:hypothetical protein